MTKYSLVFMFLGLCALSLSLTFVCHALVWWLVRRRAKGVPCSCSVSVLKPMCGVDTGLSSNLAGFASQTHSNLQVLFGVASGRDRSIPYLQRFCEEHPNVEATWRVGAAPYILNPKVALLEPMARAARGQWLVVSDSNVRVPPDYVQNALTQAAPDVGLITHLVAGNGGGSLGAHFENLQLHCAIAPGICGARFLTGRTCVVGKSMFIRADALEAIGGFRSFAHYLAEDYQLGQAIERAGYRVATADVPVQTWHEGWTLDRFWGRHVRWSVMRRKISVLGYAVEGLLNPGPLFTLLLALALVSNHSELDARVALVGWIFAQALAVVTHCRMLGQRLPGWSILYNPLREWLSLAIWLQGWWTQRTEWRGKTYWVGQGTRLHEERFTTTKELGDEA